MFLHFLVERTPLSECFELNSQGGVSLPWMGSCICPASVLGSWGRGALIGQERVSPKGKGALVTKEEGMDSGWTKELTVITATSYFSSVASSTDFVISLRPVSSSVIFLLLRAIVKTVNNTCTAPVMEQAFTN